MKIIFNEERAEMRKAQFEKLFQLKIEKRQIDNRLNLLDCAGWCCSIIALAYLALSYGYSAGKFEIAILCVVINLLVPIFKVGRAIREIAWLDKTVKKGLKDEVMPLDVRYYNALKSSDKVVLSLKFDAPSEPNRKCHVFLDAQDDDFNFSKHHIGDCRVLKDPTVEENTLDLENEIALLPIGPDRTEEEIICF